MIPENRKQPDDKLINADSVKQIDWDAMNADQMAKSSFRKRDAASWDRYASYPAIGEIDESYIEELLPRFKLSSEMSVMDVGCGNGGISIALAKRVRQVVSLDISKSALESLESKTREYKLNNIKTVHGDFSLIEVGKEIPVCDVVLASRSLPMGDLRQSLIKLNSAARHLCYVVSGSTGNELAEWLCGELGLAHKPFPEYIITPNILYTMGIHANVEIFDVKGTYDFGSLDEIMAFALSGQEIVDESVREKAIELVLTKVTREDTNYIYDYRKQFALIWWRKEQP